MVNDKNILHARHAMPYHEYERFRGEEKELERIIKDGLTRSLVKHIVDRMELSCRHHAAQCIVEYAMDCAILTPQRYRMLLKAERALAHIQRNLNAK